MKKYIDSYSPQYFAFNIWDIASALAVMDAACEQHRPLILQTSMKAFASMDLEIMRKTVTDYSSKNDFPVYLHLDHCKKIEMIQTAIDAGWDSVMIDASDKSLEENLELTNKVISMAHPRNILVETEIGQIIGTEDDITVRCNGVAKIEDVARFIAETDTDMLAVAIGTAHGLYHGEPELHYELLEQTGKLTNLPIVIHGGTGLSEDAFKTLLSYKNVKKINISTDVKQAYRRGIIKGKEEGHLEEEGFDPLILNKYIHNEIMAMAGKKLSLL